MIVTGSIGRRLTYLLAGVAALLSVLSWWMVSELAGEAAERLHRRVEFGHLVVDVVDGRFEFVESRVHPSGVGKAGVGVAVGDRAFEGGDAFFQSVVHVARWARHRT